MLSESSQAQETQEPLRIGAYVRWTSPDDPRLQADGIVTGVYASGPVSVRMRIEVLHGDWSRCGGDRLVGVACAVHRGLVQEIPRPRSTEPPKVPGRGAYVRWASPVDAASWFEATVVDRAKRYVASSYAIEVRVARVSGNCHTLQGAQVGQLHVVIGSLESLARDLRVVPLYGGLTDAQCQAYWEHDRRRVEQGLPPAYGLTTEQVAVGRDRWQSAHGPAWSAALRLQVEAGEERRRAAAVRVVLPDEDLETANAPAPTPDEVWNYHRNTDA